MQSVQILSNLNYPIGKIINQELQNSVDTQIAVAFLKYSGVKIIEESLLVSLDKGSCFELIAGLDFKTTDPKAIKYFIDLKKQYPTLNFYCYGDKGENRNDIVFHPKIYLFKNKNESISIVGSTNLTKGGLMSNFEVNTVFNEKNPIYYSQLQAIYNSVKYTDSLFTPDDDYLLKYSDVFSAFEKNEDNAKKDKGVQKIIKDISEKENILPGTIPSINSMICSFMKLKQKEGINEITLEEIYNYLEDRIKEPCFSGRFKMDTFHNTIRGELNHNEYENTSDRSMRLYKRVGRGIYALTEFGNNFNGR